jgi:hypothetical protein
VVINPSRGPRTIPEIGLIIKIQPNQIPEEKPGVTNESRTIEITANKAMREILLVFNELSFILT